MLFGDFPLGATELVSTILLDCLTHLAFAFAAKFHVNDFFEKLQVVVVLVQGFKVFLRFVEAGEVTLA